jgi:hypothetical protein
MFTKANQWVIVFYGSFTDAVSSSDYIASDDMSINEYNELEMKWKEAVTVSFKKLL